MGSVEEFIKESGFEDDISEFDDGNDNLLNESYNLQ